MNDEGFSFDRKSNISSTLLSFKTLCDSVRASYKNDLIPFGVVFPSMVLCFFEAGNINEISEIGDLNNFLLLSGTDQVQGFEVHAFISGILVSLPIAHLQLAP